MLQSFCVSFSSNFMAYSDCSGLDGVNRNFKKNYFFFEICIGVLFRGEDGQIPWEVSCTKPFHKNFKYLQEFSELFWNFIKKRLQHRCFAVNIGKFLRTPILKNICIRLLLKWLRKWLFRTFFLENHFENHTVLLILQ